MLSDQFKIQATVRIFLLVAVVGLSATATWGNSPIGPLIWARPIALGNAYVAEAGGPSSLFINSAALAEVKDNSFNSSYSNQGNDVTLTSFGGVFPHLLGGNVGLGYRNRIAAGFPISGETVDFYDHDLLLSYAGNWREDLSFGLEARYLLKNVSKTVSSLKNGQGAAFGLSLKYRHNKWLSFGAAVRDIGLKINYPSGAPDEYAPNFTVGGSFKMMSDADQGVGVNLDLSQDQGDSALVHFGVEWLAAKFAAIRIGLNQNNFCLGLGLTFSGINIDYTVQKNASLGNAVNYISIGYAPEPPPIVKPSAKLLPRHFDDVPDNYWAKRPIEALTTLNILNSYPDGTFRPERPISRAETVNLLVRAKNYPAPKENKQVFRDVPLSFWAAEVIQSAYENKLTLGYPDGDFKPRNNTSRAEAITFLARMGKLTFKPSGERPFADMSTGHWAIREVLAAKDDGILNYLKDQPFSPSQSLTRAELAEVLSRLQSIQTKVKASGL